MDAVGPRRERVFTLKRTYLPILEIAMGAYMMMCIWISVMWQIGRTSIPFLLIFAGGYFYVGVSSVWTMWKMHLESTREEELVPAAAAAEAPEIAGL